MSLPKGFNPATMKFETLKPTINIPKNVFVSQSFDYSPSLWQRFDKLIGTIGNWFADSSEDITYVLGIVLLIGLAIPFIGWLISLGWIWGIVAGLFFGGLAYYAAVIIVCIFGWICTIILLIIRYIFFSGTTFLMTLVVVGMILSFGLYVKYNSIESCPVVENVISSTTRYYCTAKSVLNVRSAPNQRARVLGTLKSKQEVDVFEISNGFARIKYNGTDGFVSMKYLVMCKKLVASVDRFDKVVPLAEFLGEDNLSGKPLLVRFVNRSLDVISF